MLPDHGPNFVQVAAPRERLNRPALEDKNMTGEVPVTNVRALRRNLVYSSMENLG
jgi:hypothetical protein